MTGPLPWVVTSLASAVYIAGCFLHGYWCDQRRWHPLVFFALALALGNQLGGLTSDHAG